MSEIKSCEGKMPPNNVLEKDGQLLCNDSRRENCEHHIIYCKDSGDIDLCDYFNAKAGIKTASDIDKIDNVVDFESIEKPNRRMHG